MEANYFKVLFVGIADSFHVKWFSEAITTNYKQIKVDIFNRGEKYNENLHTSYNRVINCSRHAVPILYKIPYLRGILKRYDVEKSFRDFSDSSEKYDAVIFLSVPYWHKATIGTISRISQKTAVFPFGSELLRCKRFNVKMATNFLKEISMVAAITPVMKTALRNIFNVESGKIKEYIMGYDSVDNILESTLTKDIAKKMLGLEGRYIITCGYNGYPGQRHFRILAEILKIKDNLPTNYTIMIPLSYGCDKSFIKRVKTFCDKNELNYIIYDKFLSNEELLYTRYATDIFIHAQPTDNGSASLHEFLLAGAKMINGEWVRYTQYENFEIPYFTFSKFNALGSTILYAIKAKNPCTVKTKELLAKTGRRNAIKDWAHFIMD